jgi:putative oxidoreductase
MTASVLLLIVGRVLLGGLFVVAGIRHFFILPVLTPMLTARGVPAARIALLTASAFELVAGLLLVLGIQVVLAAAGLVLFTLAASVLMANFWDMDGAAAEAARNVWLSNLAIIGGLLITAGQAM